MVTCAVAMPKDMVGGIKRSLETSKSSISSSSSYNSYNYQRSIVRQVDILSYMSSFTLLQYVLISFES